MGWAIYKQEYLEIDWKVIDSLKVEYTFLPHILKRMGFNSLYNKQQAEAFLRYLKAIDKLYKLFDIPDKFLDNRPTKVVFPNTFKQYSSVYVDRDNCALVYDIGNKPEHVREQSSTHDGNCWNFEIDTENKYSVDSVVRFVSFETDILCWIAVVKAKYTIEKC